MGKQFIVTWMPVYNDHHVRILYNSVVFDEMEDAGEMVKRLVDEGYRDIKMYRTDKCAKLQFVRPKPKWEMVDVT